MTIRPATLADRDALIRMALAFVASRPYGAQMPAPDVAWLRSVVDTIQAIGVVFVAEWADGVHGMIAAQAYPHPMTGERTVSELAWWVDPSHRKTSAALRLMMALHDHADRIGARTIQMIAPTTAPDVAGIYARLGYEPLETTWQRRVAA